MKRIKFAGIILLSVLLAAGCGKKDAEQTETKPSVTEETKTPEEEPDRQETEEISDEENQKDDTYNETESHEKERTVKIYYIDDKTAEPVSEDVIIKDENDIWSALQEKGILDKDCKLLSFNVDQENGKINLDFNKTLGDRIRSFGTTGETEIIGCLVNTYLDAYECDGIRLTEEGAPLETSSGANFNGYSGKIEF